MNISATVNVFRLILDPALCLPHATIPTFNHLPIPVAKAFSPSPQQKEPDIKAVVLDKDNCFARPKENAIHKPYYVSQSTLNLCHSKFCFYSLFWMFSFVQIRKVDTLIPWA